MNQPPQQITEGPRLQQHYLHEAALQQIMQ